MILVRRYYLSVPNELEEKQLIFEIGNAFIRAAPAEQSD